MRADDCITGKMLDGATSFINAWKKQLSNRRRLQSWYGLWGNVMHEFEFHDCARKTGVKVSLEGGQGTVEGSGGVPSPAKLPDPESKG
jgi:hypothetical protein